MKKYVVGLLLTLVVFMLSCKKEICSECHYDGPDETEVELGMQCGDDAEQLEKNGYTLDGTTYEVHCGDGHDHDHDH